MPAATDPSSTSTSGASGVAVVEAFLDALARFDVDAAAEHLTEDAVWRNVGWPSVEGKDAVVRLLRQMARFPGSAFTVELHNIVADGDVVLTERTDGLWAGPVGGEFWVCGTFELRDGRIAEWRDRFDHLALLRGTLTGTARALATRLRGR